MKNIEREFVVEMDEFKEIRIFTPDGVVTLTTKGLNAIEGYGLFDKTRFQKIIRRILKGEGVLKWEDGKRIDLTKQIIPPLIIYK